MLGLLNTVLSRGGSLLTYVKDGLVMANRFLTPPKLTFPVDASAEFNGTSDYIDMGEKHIANDLGITNAFTFGAWVYVEDNTDYKAIVSMWLGASTRIFWFGLDNDENIHFNVSLTGGDTFANVHNVPTNKWSYLVFRYNGSALNLFADGSQVYNVAASGNVDGRVAGEPIENLIIGAESNGTSSYWLGNLANVAIWNRALTSDEINSVMWKTYEQVSTTEKSGLQAWYKLSADEVLSGDSTATLTTYANANALTFEAPACVQTALNGLPDITDARLYSANYDIRVSADGGTVESLSCVETELNAIL
jgi:hypothetical protein